MELLDLRNLSEEERSIILNVIKRDDEQRHRQENRISQVRQEVQALRMKSVLRSGDDLSKMCARCKGSVGAFGMAGGVCPLCRFRVCKKCREALPTKGWMCSLCFKENQLKWLSGEWIRENNANYDIQTKSPLSYGTDLVRASLRVKKTAGPLGGAETRGARNPASPGSRDDAPQPASDRKRLSSIFDSIRSGLGGSPEEEDGPPPVSRGEGGCGTVVHHVSCRRRRDSNSSSNSESDPAMAHRKKAHAQMNGGAGTGGGKDTDYMGRGRGGVENRETTGRGRHGLENSDRTKRPGMDTEKCRPSQSVSSLREDRQERGACGREQYSRVPGTTSERENHDCGNEAAEKGKRRQLPQPGRVVRDPQTGNAARTQNSQTRRVTGIQEAEGERPSSGCSFTSSEWGEVTPSDSGHGQGLAPAPDRREESWLGQDRKEEWSPLGHNQREDGSTKGQDRREEGSALGQSSGYVSTSRPSIDTTDNGLNLSTILPADHSDPKSKHPPSKLPVRSPRRTSRDSVDAPQPDSYPLTSTPAAAASLVRRQSSGRSEASGCSGKTASPATKMRLLDLASSRALNRERSDSLQSWSAASDDNLSLAKDADSPSLQNQTRGLSSNSPTPPPNRPSPSPAMAPRYKSTGPTSQANNSRLSIPSVSATSHTGSSDANEEDDDNIDELFATHPMGSRLGISKTSLGDSRESLASVYSDAGEINYGSIPVSGDIEFGLDYDHKLSSLRINIKGCHDLAPVDTKHNRSDPYVKVYLLPDKTRSGKRKTKIKKHTLNPVYNETLQYHISQGELENRTLWVTVWHSDRFGRNDFLGEVLIPMDMYRFGDPAPQLYALESRVTEEVSEAAMQYKGDLIISLTFATPDKAQETKKSKAKGKKAKGSGAEGLGAIHASIKSAKNLTAVRSNGTSDPFVKGYLLPDRGRSGKQKTSVVKNSVNPTWDQDLVFEGVDPMELADRCLELTLWDHEKLGTNEFLGGVRLNLGLGSVKGGQAVDWMDGRGEEVVAWQSMMEHPNEWVNARLPLRASMGKEDKK